MKGILSLTRGLILLTIFNFEFELTNASKTAVIPENSPCEASEAASAIELKPVEILEYNDMTQQSIQLRHRLKIPCYIISIPGSNRRPWIERLIQDIHDVDCVFWDGVLLPKEDDQVQYKNAIDEWKRKLGITAVHDNSLLRYQLKRGQLGCLFAFLSLFQHLAHTITDVNQHVLILEDDVWPNTQHHYFPIFNWNKYKIADYVHLYDWGHNRPWGSQAQLLSYNAIQKLGNTNTFNSIWKLGIPIDTYIWFYAERELKISRILPSELLYPPLFINSAPTDELSELDQINKGKERGLDSPL